MLSLAVAAAVLLSGCEAFDNIQPGSDSVLDAFRGPSPAVAAELMLDEYDPNNRAIGTTLISNAFFGGEEVYLAVYRDYVDDPDRAVRAAAVRALGIHGSPADAVLVAPALGDADSLVRREAARALQRLHNQQAIGPLIAVFDTAFDPDTQQFAYEEPDEVVRAEAAYALGQYATFPVLSTLITALEDRSLAVNYNALQSLETLTGQNLGYDAAAWNAWRSAATGEGGQGVFAARKGYTYPAFERDKKLVEYLPFVPPPPNETAAAPAGLPRDFGTQQ